MIDFPVLQALDVSDYELYPGTATSPGLHADLSGPVSLIVGANGLGKSTLLSIAFRLLTGPWDIRGASNGGSLGTTNLVPAQLGTLGQREFATRTTDGARAAVATLRLTLGSHELLISRALSNLQLTQFEVDGTMVLGGEAQFQETVTQLSGLASFADWLLVLRYVTFFMDDRQVLFWDRSAQRQLLRSIFLEKDAAQEWVEKERVALSTDSAYRNRRFSVNQERQAVARLVAPDSQGAEEKLTELSELRIALQEAEDGLQSRRDRLSALEEYRSKLSYERLHASQKSDNARRDYEQAKLQVLQSRFPTSATSALIVWSQIIADAHCLICDHEVPDLREDINARLESDRCPVCGSPLASLIDREPRDIADARARHLLDLIDEAEDARLEANHAYDTVNSEASSLQAEILELDQDRHLANRRIQILESTLPEQEGKYSLRIERLRADEAALSALANQLNSAANDFRTFAEAQSTAIASNADEVKKQFDTYAQLFLLGEGELAWEPREEQIGQSSFRVRLPSYELRLGPSGTALMSVRSNANEVSESQKEFIDLAFRMALIDVAGRESRATIVIDTPESSLDRVFSERAADVLSDYASASADHRLLIASNLTDGRLIPELLKRTDSFSTASSMINLFDLARPTAATSTLSDEYAEALQRMLDEAGLA